MLQEFQGQRDVRCVLGRANIGQAIDRLILGALLVLMAQPVCRAGRYTKDAPAPGETEDVAAFKSLEHRGSTRSVRSPALPDPQISTGLPGPSPSLPPLTR
jgi:hypothetical protein